MASVLVSSSMLVRSVCTANVIFEQRLAIPLMPVPPAATPKQPNRPARLDKPVRYAEASSVAEAHHTEQDQVIRVPEVEGMWEKPGSQKAVLPLS